MPMQLRRPIETPATREAAEHLQFTLAQEVNQGQKFGLVAGVQLRYYLDEKTAVATAVTLSASNWSVVEKQQVQGAPTMGRWPGCEGFREAPLMIEALLRLRHVPDVIFVRGAGRAHIRKFGLACHLGLALEVPTIGIELLWPEGCAKTGLMLHRGVKKRGFRSGLLHEERRGLKSILGSRDRTTNIVTPPRTKTAAKKTDWIAVSGFAMNRTAATINMRVMTKQSLHDFKTGAEITEVAGIPLELTDFRNYTIVGDGNVNVPVLTIRVTDKRLRNQLEKMGFTASAENIVEIPLGELDVVPISNVGSELVADEDIVSKLIALRTISSMLENATKGKSTKYTEEQVEALRGVHVTAAMNASIPSTVPYDDKDEAISKGLIDSYTTYKIDIGSTEIPILSEGLESANDGVKRYFEITSKDGKKIDKPTMLDVVEPTNTVKAKPVKTPTAADKAQKPWFDQFAGLTDKGPWSDFLKAMGMDDEDIKEFLGWRTLTADRRVEVFKDVAKKAGEYSDLLFGQTLAPTVIFMGSTGFLPDAIQAEMMAPEDFGAKYKIKIVKALSEATFFVLPDGRVLSVRPETAWYTTPAGAAAIKGEVDDAA